MNEPHGSTPQGPWRAPAAPGRKPAGAADAATATHAGTTGHAERAAYAEDGAGPLGTQDLFAEARRPEHSAYVTPEGAAWLASASSFPRSVVAMWSARPAAPSVLPCGTVFDVVNLPALFGRRVLERLWASGPGSGPVAVHHGRVLLLVAPGTAQRLPALLGWEEWAGAVPSMLCHGSGDAVTVPPPYGPAAEGAPSRWVVAPDSRSPWLPDAGVLLWACLRAARRTPRGPAPALVSTPGGA